MSKLCAVIHPAGQTISEKDARLHPFFGSRSDAGVRVEDVMNHLRGA